jgi:hypothetical protein
MPRIAFPHEAGAYGVRCNARPLTGRARAGVSFYASDGADSEPSDAFFERGL